MKNNTNKINRNFVQCNPIHISCNSIANKILLLTVPRHHSVYRSHVQIYVLKEILKNKLQI